MVEWKFRTRGKGFYRNSPARYDMELKMKVLLSLSACAKEGIE
jgi:hypothetical protein